jgi:hypothetical protein
MSSESYPTIKYNIIIDECVSFEENGDLISIRIGDTKLQIEEKIGLPEEVRPWRRAIPYLEWKEKFGEIPGFKEELVTGLHSDYSRSRRLNLEFADGALNTITVSPPSKAIIFGKDIVNRSKKKIKELLEANGHQGVVDGSEYEFPTAGIFFYSPENVPHAISITRLNRKAKSN